MKATRANLEGRARVACLALGLVVGVTYAASTFNWSDFFDLHETEVYTVEHWDGAHTILDVTRGPLDEAAMTFTLSAVVTIDATDMLHSMSLLVADDQNSNGSIDPDEWATVATGSIHENAGRTIGQIAPVAVTATKDAYRILMDREDIGLVHDEVVADSIVD